MKTIVRLLLLVSACTALADVGHRAAGVYLGPVHDIDCSRDGGLLCTRDSGTAIGSLRCNGATSTEAGCVTPAAQTWAGTKTLTGDVRIVGHVHASLTACSSGVKGTWQTCTTHNAPVFCDGTNNIEFVGGASSEEMLAAVYVNGVPPPVMGGFTLASTTSWTITAIGGSWGIGTGAGSITVAVIHSGGTCSCAVDCDAPTGRNACTGNCTVAPSAAAGVVRSSSGCTIDPYVNGNLYLMGVRP